MPAEALCLVPASIYILMCLAQNKWTSIVGFFDTPNPHYIPVQFFVLSLFKRRVSTELRNLCL